jgi:hypothetical protein
MSEFNQSNDQHKGPQIKSEMKESDITMKIKKNKKQPKTEQPTEAQPVPFLDDHVDSYGKNLMASIANLIQESKKDDGPKRKKKTMTPEMIERCRQNLAKGRETIRKNKEKGKPTAQPVVESPAPAQAPTIAPDITPPNPIPVISQPVPKPAPIMQPQAPPKPPEKVRLRYGARLF